MKKLLLLFFFLPLLAYSQEKETTKEPETKSKAVEFMSKDGIFIKKEFYDVGKIKGLTCQVLIMQDIVTQKKVGCLRLETSHSTQYTSDTYVGTLDSDELDACLKSLNYLVSEVLISQPTAYTEVEYKTRDGVRFGAFNNLKKANWSAFVYTKSYTSRSASFFDSENISELIQIMENAKSMIAEKTK